MTPSKTPLAILKTFLARLLLLVLIASFGVWGIGDALRQNSSNTVAHVGDTAILTQEFQREWRYFQESMQGKLPAEMQNAPTLQQNVLQRMVQQRLTILAAQDAGLSASPLVVADMLRRDPVYQDIRGKFDAKMYKRVLESNQMTDAQFTEVMGDQLIMKLFTESLTSPFLKPTQAQMNLALASEQQTRTVDFIELPIDQVASVQPPSTQDLKQEYERDKNSYYLAPETRSFELVIIPASHIEERAQSAISDEEVKEYRDSNADELKKLSDEEADARIRADLLPSKVEEASHDLEITLEDAVASGDNLASVLKTAKLDFPIQTVSNVEEGATDKDVASEFIAQAFRMEEDETSSLLTSEKGDYYVMHVSEIRAAAPKPFETVKDEVAKRYLDAHRTESLDAMADSIKTKLEAANGVDARNAVLKEYGIKPLTLILARRADSYKTLSPVLRYNIFNAQPGDVLGVAANTKTAARQMAILVRINVPAADKIASDVRVEAEMQKLMGESVSQNIMRALQVNHPVSISLPKASENGAS